MGKFNTLVAKVLKTPSLSIGADGSEVAISATPAEINRICDATGKIVSVTGATQALTQAAHANRIVLANRAGGIAFTLPEATGTGDVYTIILGTAMSSGSLTIVTADTTNADYVGQVTAVDLDSATTPVVYQSLQATGNDTITMNRTTQGGVNVYVDWYRLTDVATDVWLVEGQFLVPTGSNPVTPFSSAA